MRDFVNGWGLFSGQVGQTQVYTSFVSRRNLRSASTASLVPRFQRKTLGGRAFPVAAAQAWNSLLSHVTSSSSLASFKRSLKTELFLRSHVEAWYRLMLLVTFLTLLSALEVNIDLRHVNHIRYYYYFYYYGKITQLRKLMSHRGLFSKTRSGWRNTSLR